LKGFWAKAVEVRSTASTAAAAATTPKRDAGRRLADLATVITRKDSLASPSEPDFRGLWCQKMDDRPAGRNRQ